MSAKRIVGIVCFVLAIYYSTKAARIVSRYVDISDPSGLGVSRVVGAFLPAFVLLIIGLWLFKKPKQT